MKAGKAAGQHATCTHARAPLRHHTYACLPSLPSPHHLSAFPSRLSPHCHWPPAVLGWRFLLPPRALRLVLCRCLLFSPLFYLSTRTIFSKSAGWSYFWTHVATCFLAGHPLGSPTCMVTNIPTLHTHTFHYLLHPLLPGFYLHLLQYTTHTGFHFTHTCAFHWDLF